MEKEEKNWKQQMRFDVSIKWYVRHFWLRQDGGSNHFNRFCSLSDLHRITSDVNAFRIKHVQISITFSSEHSLRWTTETRIHGAELWVGCYLQSSRTVWHMPIWLLFKHCLLLSERCVRSTYVFNNLKGKPPSMCVAFTFIVMSFIRTTDFRKSEPNDSHFIRYLFRLWFKHIPNKNRC